MSESDPRTCPSCGARLDPDAEVCDLCGTAVEPEQPVSREEAAEATRPTTSQDGSSSHEGVYCNQCGWQNPEGANFCSKCGSRLQEVSTTAGVPEAKPETRPAAPPPSSSSEPASSQADARDEAASPDDSRRRNQMVGILVGASLLVVLALFLMLVYGQQEGGASAGASQQSEAMRRQAPGPQQQQQSAMSSRAAPADTQSALAASDRPPLGPPFAERADSLKQVIANASASEKTARRRELAEMYVGAGRPDLAALQERRIAQAEDTPEAWTRAGDQFYEWMMNASDDGEKGKVASEAAAAYERVLQKQESNHDVRTRLGWTYLQTRQNPMRGIREIKRVINEDPDHVAARMNYGIALAQIGRFDKAVKQFEDVKEVTGSDSPTYKQAEKIIQNLRQQRSSG